MNVIKNFLLQKLSPDFCKLGFFIVVFIKLKVVMRVAGVEGNVQVECDLCPCYNSTMPDGATQLTNFFYSMIKTGDNYLLLKTLGRMTHLLHYALLCIASNTYKCSEE